VVRAVVVGEADGGPGRDGQDVRDERELALVQRHRRPLRLVEGPLGGGLEVDDAARAVRLLRGLTRAQGVSFLALAYFLAELWHGPSRRTWQLARVAAALAVIGPPLLWLLRQPLCAIARTEQVNEGTEVCASLSRTLVLTDVQMFGVILAIGGLITAGVLFWRFRAAGGPLGNQGLYLPIAFSVALVGLAIVVVGAGLQNGANAVFSADVQAEWPAFAALLLLLVPAYFVLRATDPRKFTLGVIGAAAVWFVAFYPNIASLPVPTAFSQIHLGLLPTWNWGFQFGVNMDEPSRGSPEMSVVALLAVAVVVLCLTSIYAARAWRARDEEPNVSGALPEAGSGL
jgi:hypothetical protein